MKELEAPEVPQNQPCHIMPEKAYSACLSNHRRVARRLSLPLARQSRPLPLAHLREGGSAAS